MNTWCQTIKKQPSRDEWYLAYLLTRDGENVMLTAQYVADKGWNVPDEWKDTVSHWQHLPKPPKTEMLVVHK